MVYMAKVALYTINWLVSITMVESVYSAVIETNRLMVYKAKVAICFEILTKHSNQSEDHVEFLNVKPGGT